MRTRGLTRWFLIGCRSAAGTRPGSKTKRGLLPGGAERATASTRQPRQTGTPAEPGCNAAADRQADPYATRHRDAASRPAALRAKVPRTNGQAPKKRQAPIY